MIIYSRRQKLKITKDRKKRVIDLNFNQHKSYAEIAQIERMSPRDNTCYYKGRRSKATKT